jgi:hypothetical protein
MTGEMGFWRAGVGKFLPRATELKWQIGYDTQREISKCVSNDLRD